MKRMLLVYVAASVAVFGCAAGTPQAHAKTSSKRSARQLAIGQSSVQVATISPSSPTVGDDSYRDTHPEGGG